MRIDRWLRFVFVCQLVEVIIEADDNGTSGEDGLALLGSLVGESHLRIPKFEREIMFSNIVPLVSVELKYHAEWCALKSPGICRHHHMVQGRKVTSYARACWGM